MTEYIVDFGNKSTAFVGLAMAEAVSHGASLKEEIVRCRDCICLSDDQRRCARFALPLFEEGVGWTEVGTEVEPDGFCAWGERREA